MLANKSSVVARPSLLRSSRIVSRPVVCQAWKPDGEARVPVAVASLAAVMLATGAFAPDDALAAKTGGRAGGSSFASRKASPAPSASSTSVTNTTVVVGAPPVYSSYGFGGFGSPFGVSVFPTFPVFGFGFGFGGFVQLFLILAVVSVIFSVIRGIGSAASGGKKEKDGDGWGDL